MRVLFIGGTGVISTACAERAVADGLELSLLNRGRRGTVAGTGQLTADISDAASARQVLGDSDWDVVVDFIAFRPDDLRQRFDLLRGRVGQFIFISSASAYQKPVCDFPVTESTPLANPFWAYSRDKIACEHVLMGALGDSGFPATIVRPSFTYDHSVIPLSFNSWAYPWTVVDRMRKGLPVVVPGDGTSLWQLTCAADFAGGLLGLFGHPGAIGQAFHITTDEVLSWNQIYRITAAAAGVDEPRLVHISSDFIVACLPERRGGLHGDKSESVVLDNSKIKRFVPDFKATCPYRQGIARSIAWFEADPARQRVDVAFNAAHDRLVETYRAGEAAALETFGRTGGEE